MNGCYAQQTTFRGNVACRAGTTVGLISLSRDESLWAFYVQGYPQRMRL